MLTIHMKSGGRRDPVVSQLSLVELFRTVRVCGEVPFIEPSPGTLLNLTHVERIYDDAPEQAAADEVEREAQPGPPLICPHGYIEGTCSVCKAIAEVEAQQPPDDGAQGLR